MTNRKVNFHEKIISFLNSDPKIEEWWSNNKINYTMDVPMMLVGEIEHLLKNFNHSTAICAAPKDLVFTRTN